MACSAATARRRREDRAMDHRIAVAVVLVTVVPADRRLLRCTGAGSARGRRAAVPCRIAIHYTTDDAIDNHLSVSAGTDRPAPQVCDRSAQPGLARRHGHARGPQRRHRSPRRHPAPDGLSAETLPTSGVRVDESAAALEVIARTPRWSRTTMSARPWSGGSRWANESRHADRDMTARWVWFDHGAPSGWLVVARRRVVLAAARTGEDDNTAAATDCGCCCIGVIDILGAHSRTSSRAVRRPLVTAGRRRLRSRAVASGVDLEPAPAPIRAELERRTAPRCRGVGLRRGESHPADRI